MSVITWRIFAVHPKQIPDDDDCVFLARTALPSEAFALARQEPLISRMEHRGMQLYARGCSLGACSTRWLEGSTPRGGVVLATFARLGAWHGPKGKFVRITAVVAEKRDTSGSILGYDASVIVGLEEPLVALCIPDDVAAKEWCDRQVNHITAYLDKEAL